MPPSTRARARPPSPPVRTSAWVRRTAPMRSLVPRSRPPSLRRLTRITWRRSTLTTSSRMAGARAARRSTSPRPTRRPVWKTTMRMMMRTSRTPRTRCSSRTIVQVAYPSTSTSIFGRKRFSGLG